jgi:hypothetical protein
MELHPLCSLFPRMAGAEFESLIADIKANGQREPIIIHDGMILDGGNRYRACLEAGVEPQTMKYGGGNIVSYVLSANLHRRHLSAGQHAAIVSSCQNWAEAQPVGKPIKCNLAPLATAADRASVSGVSVRTQKSADKVAKADPNLAVQVGHGDISLPKAVAQVEAKQKPKKKAAPAKVEVPAPKAEDEYTELDALKDQVAELQDALAIAHDKDSTDEEKAHHADLVASLRKELKTANAMLASITRSRDQLMVENAQLKRQVAMMQKQAKKAA